MIQSDYLFMNAKSDHADFLSHNPALGNRPAPDVFNNVYTIAMIFQNQTTDFARTVSLGFAIPQRARALTFGFPVDLFNSGDGRFVSGIDDVSNCREFERYEGFQIDDQI
jgi:hypothetical protein